MRSTLRYGKLVVVAAFCFSLSASSPSSGQTSKPTSPAEIARYQGSDREQLLVSGAKKEGKLVWYTSLTGGPDKEVPAAFEAKYPGIKVETYRASSEDLMARIVAESQARRPVADTRKKAIAGKKSSATWAESSMPLHGLRFAFEAIVHPLLSPVT